MPRINKKSYKAASKAKGMTKKQTRKAFRADTKVLNGGQSRLKRLGKGVLKIAAGAIPIIGGGIADAMANNTPAVDANTLPTFAPTNDVKSMGDNALEQGGGGIRQNPLPVADLPPALDTSKKAQAPVKSMAESQGHTSGGGASMADDGNTQEQSKNTSGGGGGGEDFRDETPTKEPKPKKDGNNKTLLIVGCVIGGLIVLAFLFKAFKK